MYTRKIPFSLIHPEKNRLFASSVVSPTKMYITSCWIFKVFFSYFAKDFFFFAVVWCIFLLFFLPILYIWVVERIINTDDSSQNLLIFFFLLLLFGYCQYDFNWGLFGWFKLYQQQSHFHTFFYYFFVTWHCLFFSSWLIY